MSKGYIKHSMMSNISNDSDFDSRYKEYYTSKNLFKSKDLSKNGVIIFISLFLALTYFVLLGLTIFFRKKIFNLHDDEDNKEGSKSDYDLYIFIMLLTHLFVLFFMLINSFIVKKK